MPKIRSISPSENAIKPELHIEVTDKLKRDEQILLDCFGTLWCEEKKIGNVHGGISDDQRQLNARHRDFARQDLIHLDLYASLSRRTLKYIEEKRDAHAHGDVELRLILTERIAELSISADENITLKVSDDEVISGEAIHQAPHERALPLLSLSSDNRLLTVNTREYPLNHRISSSDWTQQFCPALGIGNFLVFDYQVPDHTASDGDDFESRLADAIRSLEEMQSYIQEGQWNLAVLKIREVAELVRKQKTEIAQLLEQDEIESEAASEITDGMQSLFNYASKFVHREDRSGKLMERSKASKEDAYLAYTVGTSVVNLISAKLKRQRGRSDTEID